MNSFESFEFQDKDYYCEKVGCTVQIVLKLCTKTHIPSGRKLRMPDVVEQCSMLGSCGVMEKLSEYGTRYHWGKCDYRQKSGLND